MTDARTNSSRNSKARASPKQAEASAPVSTSRPLQTEQYRRHPDIPQQFMVMASPLPSAILELAGLTCPAPLLVLTALLATLTSPQAICRERTIGSDHPRLVPEACRILKECRR
jgi:hypothetical protein